jgi:hypothetical protein
VIFAGIQSPLGATKDPNVEVLQRALNTLAITTGDARYQVAVDGIVGPVTMTASIAATNLVANYISSDIAKYAIIGAMIYATTDPTKVQTVIKSNASELSKAILAYIAAKAITGSGSGTTATGTGTKSPRVVLDPRIFATVTSTTPGTAPTPTPGAPPVAVSKIFAYDKRARMYRVAQQTSQLQGEPALFTEVGVSATKPTDATEVRYYDYLVATGTLPWYRKWWGITILGVGATAAVVGTIAVVRSKKSEGVHGLLGSDEDDWNPNDLVSARRDAGRSDPSQYELDRDRIRYLRRVQRRRSRLLGAIR